jgi:hypothetical protein
MSSPPARLHAPVLSGRFASAAFRGRNVGQIAVRFCEAGFQTDRRRLAPGGVNPPAISKSYIAFALPEPGKE